MIYDSVQQEAESKPKITLEEGHSLERLGEIVEEHIVNNTNLNNRNFAWFCARDMAHFIGTQARKVKRAQAQPIQLNDIEQEYLLSKERLNEHFKERFQDFDLDDVARAAVLSLGWIYVVDRFDKRDPRLSPLVEHYHTLIDFLRQRLLSTPPSATPPNQAP